MDHANANLRTLTVEESRILSTLLAVDFPGRAQLVEQSQDVLARVIDENGSLELVTDRTPPAPVVKRIPVEAEQEDDDGVTVHVLLHVVDGRLHELEIYREDSARLRAPIDPEQLHIGSGQA